MLNGKSQNTYLTTVPPPKNMRGNENRTHVAHMNRDAMSRKYFSKKKVFLLTSTN